MVVQRIQASRLGKVRLKADLQQAHSVQSNAVL